MTALTESRLVNDRQPIRFPTLTLASGQKVYAGGIACLNGAGKVVDGTANPALLPIGVFNDDVDASSTGTNADTDCVVDLGREIQLLPFANDTVAPVSIVGSYCYLLDDQTVTADPAGAQVLGRVWTISSAYVGVELLATGAASGQLLVAADISFTSNDYAPTSILSGAVYQVPTTGAASTVTLPVTDIPDGTTVQFVADGTANGHTVTYREGTTAISAAATASKRHLAICTKNGGHWSAVLTVSP